MSGYSLVTPPAALPVTLAECKTHCRIDGTMDDGYLQSLMFQATAQAENITRRALVTQTWLYYLDEWPDGDFIELPFGCLQSVTSIKYKDSDGTEYTFSTDYYDADTTHDPGSVVLEYGESWPSETLYPSNPIYIQFVCGYGAHTAQPITGATNASPIVLSIAAHGRSTGDVCLVSGVGGNTAANGQWIITNILAGTLSLNGSVGNGAYSAGGTLTKLDVPDAIRHAIKIMVAEAYRQRESNVSVASNIMDLLRSYRLLRL